MKSESKLIERHPWLKVTTTVEDYVEPGYYDELLKPYVFFGKSDLDILSDYLKRVTNLGNALELGSGSGRATNVTVQYLRGNDELSLVDLSKRMLTFCKSKYEALTNVKYAQNDNIQYLASVEDVFDTVYSLWSLSHSIHQHLTAKGLKNGGSYVTGAIEKFVEKNMRTGSTFFLIHFDSKSDEQRILMKQWAKVFPVFKRMDIQSPSKLLMDRVLLSLSERGLIEYSVEHLVGEPIRYKDQESALEIFMNFHMESYFNETSECENILRELQKDLATHANVDGSLSIRPGCFIYKFTKV